MFLKVHRSIRSRALDLARSLAPSVAPSLPHPLRGYEQCHANLILRYFRPPPRARNAAWCAQLLHAEGESKVRVPLVVVCRTFRRRTLPLRRRRRRGRIAPAPCGGRRRGATLHGELRYFLQQRFNRVQVRLQHAAHARPLAVLRRQAERYRRIFDDVPDPEAVRDDGAEAEQAQRRVAAVRRAWRNDEREQTKANKTKKSNSGQKDARVRRGEKEGARAPRKPRESG